MAGLLSGNYRLLEALGGPDVRQAPGDVMDDEFDGDSLDTSRWTWENQGATTAVLHSSRLEFYVRENANVFRGIHQTTPTGSWRFQAKLHNDWSTSSGIHLYAAQGTGVSDEVRGIGGFGSNLRGLTWGDFTSGSAGWGAISLPSGPTSYVELEWDGTDLAARASIDGVSYTDIASVTTGYTPAHVGLGFCNRTGVTKVQSASWFRRMA